MKVRISVIPNRVKVFENRFLVAKNVKLKLEVCGSIKIGVGITVLYVISVFTQIIPWIIL